MTMVALSGFAANSLLCRAALAGDRIDPLSFTAIRITSGALLLSILVGSPRTIRRAGGWLNAALLCAYAIAFSLAYVKLGAATGALILFAAVQLSMLAAGLRAGERPSAAQWIGVAFAMGGLAAMVAPGLHAPDPAGAVLMAGAGLAWGGYSVLGRGSSAPLADTASNFARGIPFVLFALLPSLLSLHSIHATNAGIGLAVASGALASGLAYAMWYAVLPSLGSTRAAAVQLSVPVLAAIGGVAFLDETVHARFLVCAAAILTGVALAVWRR
jgi:drug/metabolite transporter (DMT)-like permease